MTAWFLLGAAVIATAFAQVSFKKYFNTRRLRFLAAAIVLFLSIPLVAYLAIRSLGVGMVAMAMSLTHPIILWLSHATLDEVVTRDHVFSIALIVAGVCLYAL